ncbi:hypothetical protein cypCar_00045098 [Cyprinus carpio]|nr:hypothetical protein cypCar_00045098 [Cyprinus carpio]
MAKRIVDSARNILNKFIPDIYIHTDHMKGASSVHAAGIEFLRHIRDFFEIMFKVEQQKPGEDEQKGGEKVLMTCVGAGYSNLSKTIK